MRAAFLGALLASLAAGSAQAATQLTLKDVPLRPGVTVDLNLEVFSSPRRCCLGKTVFAVHGVANTAAAWEAMATELLSHELKGPRICRVVALDLPGHGGSGLPNGLLFGQLLLDDYVAAVINSLERLRALKIRPRTLVGHSMGGAILQQVQQALKDQGSSLFRRFRVTRVVLLAPAITRPLPWSLADSGAAAGIVAPFIKASPTLGLYIDAPDAAWQALFFSNPLGQLAPGAPSVAAIGARGLNAREAVYAASQLFGSAPFTRPAVDAGIFGLRTGTLLHTVCEEQDVFISTGECQAQHQRLVGTALLSRQTLVTGAYAVHSQLISDPQAVLKAMTWHGVLFF
jgi:pimeloyl-ACP methyl ester carboxylesterase